MTKVKICGITSLQDIEYVNEAKPELAGFVMFFERSKRNIDEHRAVELLNKLDSSIKSVAVTVKPSLEQISIAKKCGFDFIQIHGDVPNDFLKNSPLPVLRAFNVSDIKSYWEYSKIDNIKGYLFDSQLPGSGKTFDWSLLEKIQRDGKMFILAGGLTPNNVKAAVEQVKPDGVDVSSGVENENGVGKSRNKILEFVENVRSL